MQILNLKILNHLIDLDRKTKKIIHNIFNHKKSLMII